MRHSIAILVLFCGAISYLTGHRVSEAQIQTSRDGNPSDTLSQIVFKRIRMLTQFETLRDQANPQILIADIKLAVAAASPELVHRQSLTIAVGDEVIATKEFDANGGTLATTTSTVPGRVRVTLTVDFQPQWDLPSFVRVINSKVDSSGIVGLLQVFSDETTLFVDHSFYVQRGDFVIGTLRVKPTKGETQVISRLLATHNSQTARAFNPEFAYLADLDPESLVFQISGRLKGSVPDVLATLRNNAIKEATAVKVQWICPSNRPVFVPIGSASGSPVR